MNRTEIEAEIRRVLDTETKAVPLSLFAKLASTPAERREITRSPLFREAQQRLSDLQRSEMAAFRKAVSQVDGQLPDGLVSYRAEELPAS